MGEEKEKEELPTSVLLCSDWSPQEEMVQSFIVPIYTRQKQQGTRTPRYTLGPDLNS